MRADSSRKRSLNVFPFITFLAASTISLTGSVFTLVALPWFVLTTTQSASKVGLTSFFIVVAIIIAGVVSGVIVDRLGYKRTSVMADIGSAIGIAAVPLLYATRGLAFWQLLALVFLSNFFNAPGTSARTALLPEIADLASIPLEQANAFFQTIQNVSRLVGAPLAGVLIAFLSPVGLLWIDAATFAVSAGIISLTIPTLSNRTRVEVPDHDFIEQRAIIEAEVMEIDTVQIGPETEVGTEQPSLRGFTFQRAKAKIAKSYLIQWKEGITFILADRLLFTLILMIMITNFIESPFLNVVIPVYMQARFSNAVDFGLTIAAFGAGAVLGAFLYSLISRRIQRRPTYIGAFLLFGIPFWVLALFPPLPLTLILIALMGMASGPINPILYTIYQERTPEGMRGRVLGILTSGAYITIPLGGILIGYLLDRIGVRSILIAEATGYLIATLSLLFNPLLRDMDEPIIDE